MSAVEKENPFENDFTMPVRYRKERLDDASVLIQTLLNRVPLDLRDDILTCIRMASHFMGDLPASVAHHHNELGGLFKHSLETMLEVEKKELTDHDYIAALVAALYHDIGKVHDYLVGHNNIWWRPEMMPFDAFAHKHGINEVLVRPRSGRKGEHKHINPYYFIATIPESMVAYLGRKGLCLVLEAIQRPSANDVGKAAHQADVNSVTSDIKKEDKKPTTNPKFNVRKIAPDFLSITIDFINNGGFVMDGPNRQIHIGKETTFVEYSDLTLPLYKQGFAAKNQHLPPGFLGQRLKDVLKDASWIVKGTSGEVMQRMAQINKTGFIISNKDLFPNGKPDISHDGDPRQEALTATQFRRQFLIALNNNTKKESAERKGGVLANKTGAKLYVIDELTCMVVPGVFQALSSTFEGKVLLPHASERESYKNELKLLIESGLLIPDENGKHIRKMSLPSRSRSAPGRTISLNVIVVETSVALMQKTSKKIGIFPFHTAVTIE